MLLPLVDVLRCPGPHEPSSLVLTVHRWSGQRVADGELGCPVCRARYAIRGGSTDFTGGTAIGAVVDEAATAAGPARPRSHEAHAVRLAAQLALGDPGGIVLLTGAYAALAGALLDLVDTTCVLVNAPFPDVTRSTTIRVGNVLPMASGVLRGAAVDQNQSAPEVLSEVTRCLTRGGKIVAPASVAIPPGVDLVASDELEWVGEAAAGVPGIQLGRRKGM